MNHNLEILQKLNLDVKKVDSRGEAHCICPLHADKDPSLSINIFSGKYQCFAGCIKGNSIHDLVFKLTGETIHESQENNWLDLFKRKLVYKKVNGYRLPAIPILPNALNNIGEKYLVNRGFNQQTIKEWDLKWWEDQNAIVIPIPKIGFILRYLSGEKKYKYVSGTRISETLFGIHKFNNTNGSAILVEGSLDAIWLSQNGFNNTLAILGSNLSDTQYRVLQGLCNKVIILLDNDLGGNKSEVGIIKKLKKDFLVGICRLPNGKDPNDCDKEILLDTINNARRV